MKFSAYTKPAVRVILVSSLLVGSLAFAQWGGGGNNNNNNNNTGGKKKGPTPFSPIDIANFLSSFSVIPTKFTWDDDIPQTSQSSPERDPPAQPAPLPPPQPPAAAPPPCLSAEPYNAYSDIYNGTCSSISPQLPYVNNVGYEGTKCFGALSEVHVHVEGGSIVRDIQLKPPDRNQFERFPVEGALSVNCSDFRDSNNQPISIAGKTLVGTVNYRCQAGVWRVMSINCTDKITPCLATTQAFTAVAKDGTSYTTPAVSIPETDVGQYSTATIACTSLPSPGPTMKWKPGTIGIYCDGAKTFQLAQGICEKEVLPTNTNTTYPNCTGSNTAFYPQIKPGFDMCTTADGLKYYWMTNDTNPPTTCADTFNGCTF